VPIPAACDRAGGCCAACNAGAGASRGRHHVDLVPPAALPIECRKRKQPPAGTPVPLRKRLERDRMISEM